MTGVPEIKRTRKLRAFRLAITVAVYCALIFLIARSIFVAGEHEEVGSLASLICYSCIGV